MAQNFLAIANNNRTDKIGLYLVAKYDFLPWLASIGMVLLLFIGVSTLVGSANPNMTDDDAIANLYTWARPLYYALVVLAVFAARRSRDIWTWAMAIALIIFFVPQYSTNIATVLFPNSIFQAMIALIGFLAIERLIEYIQMRYIVKLETPILSMGALVGYIALICCVLFLEVPLFFELFWN